MPSFEAYHGVSAVTHQERVDQLSSQGYRPISLSVSGDPGDARYSAVWVQRPGSAWWAVHGLSAVEYQTRFDDLTGQGYAPVLVSATGAANQAIFAALFEKGVATPWFARHNLRWDPLTNPDTITHENQRAFDQGYLPHCLAVYGNPDDRRFAGIWVKNEAPVPWSWWWTDPTTYQRFFETEVLAGVRPAYVSVAPDGWILSVFRDEPIGEWWARHGLTGADYQAEFDVRLSTGTMPIMLQAGGAGSSTRYAAIFAHNDEPLHRQWSVTGSVFAGSTDMDAAVRSFMTAHAIRAGSVAVARNGSILASRGYTWAEPNYPVTQPTTLFRIASLSKIFTAAAIDRLVIAGRLTWNTPAFGFLGINSALLASQMPDPLVSNITIGQLVLRQSGLQRDFDNDPRGIAGKLGITTTPTRDTLVRYLYGQPIDHAPGTGDLYSNTAFYLLTSIIERASGHGYLDELNSGLLNPMGIHDVFISATAVGSRRPNEVSSYDHPGIKLSQIDVATDTFAPNAYGGDFVLESGEGPGGLLTSAPSIARFIAHHAVWNVGGREIGTRYGTLDGTCTGAFSRGDGLDVAYLFNRRVTDTEHDDITAAINKVLDLNPI
jgi:CubicO group peptidase (beta-lactamase class C family)